MMMDACGASPCDCDQRVWTFDFRWKRQRRTFQYDGGVPRTRREALLAYNASSCNPECVLGPMRRASDKPHDFDVIDTEPFEDDVCYDCAAAPCDCAQPIWGYMTYALARGEALWPNQMGPGHGRSRPYAAQTRESHIKVARTIRDSAQAFLVGPLQRVTEGPPVFVSPGTPAWPTKLPVDSKMLPTSWPERKLTVTQAGLARLLFDSEPGVHGEACRRAEVAVPGTDEALKAEDLPKLRRVLDIMWNKTDRASRELAEAQAAAIFVWKSKTG